MLSDPKSSLTMTARAVLDDICEQVPRNQPSPYPQGEAARRLGVSPRSINRSLCALRSKGLIDFCPGAGRGMPTTVTLH